MNQPQVKINETTGQILSIIDRESGDEVVGFEPGQEFFLNGRPLVGKVRDAITRDGEHITTIDVTDSRTYGAGYRLLITRLITFGGDGLHTGAPRSAHIRYHLKRVPWGDFSNSMDMIWGAPVESPLYVESFGVFGGKTRWFGPQTKMRALAIGGSGPREHVSFEDGPIDEVIPWLQTGFRSTFPGQMTIPGAMYYDASNERYLWVMSRRPHVGGRILFSNDSQQFEYNYFQQLKVHDEIVTPEINLFWGKGIADSERVLATQFDRFEEPPAWWNHSTWFWLHPCWQREGSFEACCEAVKILSGECGVNGFGIALHDVPWSGRDIDPASLLPSPGLGGDDGLRKLTATIKQQQGHSYVWSSRTGLHPVRDRRPRWCVRGEDGRRMALSPPTSIVQVDILNNDDSEYRQHLFDMVKYYVGSLGVDGMFWDSGAQPMPPDFTDRGNDISPGESMTAPIRFYDDVYRIGRALSPDFFMWFEGISTELRSNAFAVDNRMHGVRSAHSLMQRISRLGKRRLAWRSAWSHDLASGFPFISPTNDVGKKPGAETYRNIAADPFNRKICQIVRERGHREAVGVADGVSQLNELLIVSPGAGKTAFSIAKSFGEKLTNTLDGTTAQGQSDSTGGVAFEGLAPGIWTKRA